MPLGVTRRLDFHGPAYLISSLMPLNTVSVNHIDKCGDGFCKTRAANQRTRHATPLHATLEQCTVQCSVGEYGVDLPAGYTMFHLLEESVATYWNGVSGKIA